LEAADPIGRNEHAMPTAPWPPMIWIGGAPGAGKSTLARTLAHAEDLPLHPVDRWTYEHAARLPVPRAAEEATPDGAADAFVRYAGERLPLVLADVRGRGLGAVPALVEGPQLLPELAGPLPAGHAVWLLPDPALTRRARERRLAEADDPSARSRPGLFLGRDVLLTERIRKRAAVHGGAVVEVGPEPDWAQVGRDVRSALAAALRAAPRLEPGRPLAAQRRFENAAAARQIALWTATEGITDPVRFPFACECGRSGCAATCTATAPEYTDRPAGAPLLAPGHLPPGRLPR